MIIKRAKCLYRLFALGLLSVIAGCGLSTNTVVDSEALESTQEQNNLSISTVSESYNDKASGDMEGSDDKNSVENDLIHPRYLLKKATTWQGYSSSTGDVIVTVECEYDEFG